MISVQCVFWKNKILTLNCVLDAYLLIDEQFLNYNDYDRYFLGVGAIV